LGGFDHGHDETRNGQYETRKEGEKNDKDLGAGVALEDKAAI
jgi:hypothetical protein